MRARLYDPRLGRFTSPDPWPAYLPEPVTLNRYLYALADPLSQVDPFGLFSWTGKNKEGKCRGLRDVAERVSAPLSNIATAAGAVAVLAAGVVVLCPPCGIAGLSYLSISAAAGTVAFWGGWSATGATCVAAGTLADFDCAVGIAAGSIGGRLKLLARQARSAFGFAENAPILATGATFEQAAKFGTGAFGLFFKGATSAGKMLRGEK